MCLVVFIILLVFGIFIILLVFGIFIILLVFGIFIILLVFGIFILLLALRTVEGGPCIKAHVIDPLHKEGT